MEQARVYARLVNPSDGEKLREAAEKVAPPHGKVIDSDNPEAAFCLLVNYPPESDALNDWTRDTGKAIADIAKVEREDFQLAVDGYWKPASGSV